MSFAIIRGSNGRRHDVDFGDAEIEVDVAIGSETVQITVEAIHDQAPSDKRRSPPSPSLARSSLRLWGPT